MESVNNLLSVKSNSPMRKLLIIFLQAFVVVTVFCVLYLLGTEVDAYFCIDRLSKEYETGNTYEAVYNRVQGELQSLLPLGTNKVKVREILDSKKRIGVKSFQKDNHLDHIEMHKCLFLINDFSFLLRYSKENSLIRIEKFAIGE